MNTPRSWLTLGVAPVLILGAMVLPFVLNWGDLPNPMASHWDFAGNPNGSMPPIILLLVVAGIFLVMWWAVSRTLGRTPYEAPSFVAGRFFVGMLLAGITWLSVVASRGVDTWEAAAGIGFVELPVLVALATAGGYFGWVVAGGGSDHRGAAGTPTLDLGEPSNAVWSSHGNGWLLQVVGVVLIVGGLAVWGWSTLGLVLMGLLVLVFAEVRVTVSNRGVVVSWGCHRGRSR